jgi:hypothetical protein
VDFVVSRAPQPKNGNDGRQKADRKAGAPLHVTELVAMDETGAEVIKVTTARQPKVVKRQRSGWSGWSRRRGKSTVGVGVAFRADAIVPLPATATGAAASAGA